MLAVLHARGPVHRLAPCLPYAAGIKRGAGVGQCRGGGLRASHAGDTRAGLVDTATFRREVRETSFAHRIRRRRDPCLRDRTSCCAIAAACRSSPERRWPSPGGWGDGRGPAQLAMQWRSEFSLTINSPPWSPRWGLPKPAARAPMQRINERRSAGDARLFRQNSNALMTHLKFWS